MANIYESMNVKQKLAKARLYFLNKKVTKSGKNMNLEFKYFELVFKNGYVKNKVMEFVT